MGSGSTTLGLCKVVAMTSDETLSNAVDIWERLFLIPANHELESFWGL